MLGNVDNLPATVRAGVVVGRDGSSQRSTNNRDAVMDPAVLVLRGPAQVSGKKLLGEPRSSRILW